MVKISDLATVGARAHRTKRRLDADGDSCQMVSGGILNNYFSETIL